MKKLILSESKLGKTVLAGKKFNKNEIIIEFTGLIMKRDELPDLINPEDDRYLQIGVDKYLGPSGYFDDYFNHSCNPNAGIRIIEDKFFLIAIKDINLKEEITWDYSTTMDEDNWEMNCECGDKNCRKKIRDFKYLSEYIKKRYIRLNIVPDFILKNLT